MWYRQGKYTYTCIWLWYVLQTYLTTIFAHVQDYNVFHLKASTPSTCPWLWGSALRAAGMPEAVKFQTQTTSQILKYWNMEMDIMDDVYVFLRISPWHKSKTSLVGGWGCGEKWRRLMICSYARCQPETQLPDSPDSAATWMWNRPDARQCNCWEYFCWMSMAFALYSTVIFLWLL